MEDRLVKCLRIAVKYYVTDIHFSLRDENSIDIEMRINGRIRKLRSQDYDVQFFRYLQYRANLDISNTLEPQTGRFETVVDGKQLALRFALVSSYHMTSGVLRILNNHAPICIENLSANPSQSRWFREICNQRSGLYVFSGPTGSGKTTTLYTILNEVEGKKIFSLEDPVEVYSEKYIQLQINDKQHLGYAEGIRQLMRHDPDIIMIGEIRDTTAARMAVRTALTGHLVVTSIHAGSCLGAIDRLKDLGIPDYQLQDTLYGISNQRLYDAEGNQKIGVYELMTRKEIQEYFETGRITQNHVTLEDEIIKAVRSGAVDPQQAAQDFHGSS